MKPENDYYCYWECCYLGYANPWIGMKWRFTHAVNPQMNLHSVSHSLSDSDDWNVHGVANLGIAMTERINRELFACMVLLLNHYHPGFAYPKIWSEGLCIFPISSEVREFFPDLNMYLKRPINSDRGYIQNKQRMQVIDKRALLNNHCQSSIQRQK